MQLDKPTTLSIPTRRHPHILDSARSALLIIDVQERFRSHIPDFSDIVRSIVILIEAAKLLSIPIILSEQYTKGLGPTANEITAVLGEHHYFEKNCFSCCGQPALMQALTKLDRHQIIVCGIETHVCVSQTVHDLMEAGYSPHVVIDAVSSRSTQNKKIGVDKMVASGALPSCVEMALFELLVDAESEKFKMVQKLVK